MQKGFGLIGILIVVALVVGIGAVVFESVFPERSLFRPSEEEKSAIDMAEEMKDALENESRITNYELGEKKEEIDMSDWKTYRNEEYGFEFKYPPSWVLDEGSVDVPSNLRDRIIYEVALEGEGFEFLATINKDMVDREYINAISIQVAEKSFDEVFKEQSYVDMIARGEIKTQDFPTENLRGRLLMFVDESNDSAIDEYILFFDISPHLLAITYDPEEATDFYDDMEINQAISAEKFMKFLLSFSK